MSFDPLCGGLVARMPQLVRARAALCRLCPEPVQGLEGAVTNVAAFGAFVDVGMRQDGLAHISVMSKSFVRDPRDIVKSGDVVRVKVLEVDVARKRTSLRRAMEGR
jgi:uncharacterized protein